MRRIIHTPAGRPRFMSLLCRHLAAQKTDFDQWVLWLNLRNPADLPYMQRLAEIHPWIVLQDRAKSAGKDSIYPNSPELHEPGNLYLRLDDDIVWIAPGAVGGMFEAREQDTESPVRFGNVVNNAMCSYLHQRLGLVGTQYGVAPWRAPATIGSVSGPFAELCHRALLGAAREGTVDRFVYPDYRLLEHEHCSINAVAWRGEDLRNHIGDMDGAEEPWLSIKWPAKLHRPNTISGRHLFSHYAFGPQYAHLDKTDVLAQYATLAPNYEPQTAGSSSCPSS